MNQTRHRFKMMASLHIILVQRRKTSTFCKIFSQHSHTCRKLRNLGSKEKTNIYSKNRVIDQSIVKIIVEDNTQVNSHSTQKHIEIEAFIALLSAATVDRKQIGEYWTPLEQEGTITKDFTHSYLLPTNSFQI